MNTDILKLPKEEPLTEFLKNNVKNGSWYFVHIAIYNKIKYMNLNTFINSGTVGFDFGGNTIIEFNCINSISPLWVMLSRCRDNNNVWYYKPLSPENILFIEEE